MNTAVQTPREPAARALRIQVLRGPDAGVVVSCDEPPIRIGRGPGCHVRLSDSGVSTQHVEIVAVDGRLRLRDLRSTNGTFVDGMRIGEADLEGTTTVRLGLATIVELVVAPPAEHDDARFPALLGVAPVMRGLKADMARVAASDATALITGETGTGKEVVARSIHAASNRRRGPFVVLDCGALPAELFESELFGREKGAFTGAIATVPGLFERAHGGTLFLDELGELPLELQPKLLRAVQTRSGRRVGGTDTIAYDVRLISATHRDSAAQVERGAFRQDLFYRLAVVCLEVPALRDRREDVPLLAARLARELGAGALGPVEDMLARRGDHPWPGNVRELRNAVQRVMAGVSVEADLGADPTPRQGTISVAFAIEDRFKDAKQAAIDEFERRFITQLLDQHHWNIAQAARSASLDRVSIYKILTRLGIHRKPPVE